MAEGWTLRQLAQQSRYSVSTLQRIIRDWLQNPPPIGNLDGVHYVMLDGTFVEKRQGLFAAMDARRFEVAYGRFPCSEGPLDMRRFCAELASRGLSPRAATLDGNPHLRLALRERWPTIRLQRCLVHVRRQGLSWCRRRPSRPDARALRRLFLQVTSVDTYAQRDGFLEQWRVWEERYGQRLLASTARGWVVSDLCRARSMLRAALKDMFTYLDDPAVARTTNALEGYFARLKHHYRLHHGLARHRLSVYFSWYFRLRRR